MSHVELDAATVYYQTALTSVVDNCYDVAGLIVD